jgi:hypothetical protein
VARSLFVIGYTTLTNHCRYKEDGASFFDGLNRDGVQRSAVKLEALGYDVTLKTHIAESSRA